MNLFKAITIAAVSMLVAGGANAATFGFTDFSQAGDTDHSPTNGAAGQSQLSVEVSAGAAINTVLFTFRNVGSAAMSITDVYFDDDASLLNQIVSTMAGTSAAGVSFSAGATPPNLPQGQNIDFNVSPAGAHADSDRPVQASGVNPGEVLGLTFTLAGLSTVSDVIAEMKEAASFSGKAGNNKGLRIGLHVQAFGDGASDAFVNGQCIADCGGGGTGGPDPIPLPAGLPLLATALAAGYVLKRRKG